jgi:hypothetical protein
MRLNREVCLHLRLSLIHDTILIPGLTTHRHMHELGTARSKALSTFKVSCQIHRRLHHRIGMVSNLCYVAEFTLCYSECTAVDLHFMNHDMRLYDMKEHGIYPAQMGL